SSPRLPLRSSAPGPPASVSSPSPPLAVPIETNRPASLPAIVGAATLRHNRHNHNSAGRGVRIVVAPPPVRRRLRVALRRVLPLLLAPEGRDVEVAPRRPHALVAALVHEVRAE